MFCLNSENRFLVYRKSCDMRKSFDGLCGLVRNELLRDPTSGDVFLFLNKRRTQVKLLHWEEGGLVLYYKRLEKGTFSRPQGKDNSYISWAELVLMIEGLQVNQMVQKPRFRLKKNNIKKP